MGWIIPSPGWWGECSEFLHVNTLGIVYPHLRSGSLGSKLWDGEWHVGHLLRRALGISDSGREGTQQERAERKVEAAMGAQWLLQWGPQGALELEWARWLGLHAPPWSVTGGPSWEVCDLGRGGCAAGVVHILPGVGIWEVSSLCPPQPSVDAGCSCHSWVRTKRKWDFWSVFCFCSKSCRALQPSA